MRWRPPLHRRLLLGLALVAVAALAFSALASAPDSGNAAEAAEPGWFRRLSRRFQGLFQRGKPKVSPPATQAADPQSTRRASSQPQPAAASHGSSGQRQAGGAANWWPGKGDGQSSEGRVINSRPPAVDSTLVVWQTLALPHYRTGKVQDALEHWHAEAAGHLLNADHIQELLRTYLSVLEWAGKLFVPELAESLKQHESKLSAVVLDVDVCSKRLLYLSGIPVVTSRGSDSQDIDLRKTKALHTLSVFYVLQGRLTQLSALVRQSSKLVSRELTKRRALTPQTAKVLMPFTRLARYSLDALDYLAGYYRELRTAIIASVVHPLFVTRTYSRLHVSLQTVGQFFATCGHARKIGESLQRDIAELKAASAPGRYGQTASQLWEPTGTDASKKQAFPSLTPP